MKIEIPKIVQRLDLREYAAEMEAEIEVWVNPPGRVMERWDELVMQGTGNREQRPGLTPARDDGEGEIGTGRERELRKILVELWSQGKEGTRWTEEEVERLERDAQETDPGLLKWLITRTWQMVFEHRLLAKKKL